MNYTKEQLNEIFDKLPEDLKDAIFSIDSATAMEEIGAKYHLHIDQIGNLGSETGYVLLGVELPESLIGKISQKLGLSMETSAQIASELNTKVFSKVRDSLRRIHEEKKGIKTGLTSERKAEISQIGAKESLRPEDILRGIENPHVLNVPGQTLDVLSSLRANEQAKPASPILGFIAPIDIMEKKFGESVSLVKKETEIGAKQAVDVYREPI